MTSETPLRDLIIRGVEELTRILAVGMIHQFLELAIQWRENLRNHSVHQLDDEAVAQILRSELDSETLRVARQRNTEFETAIETESIMKALREPAGSLEWRNSKQVVFAAARAEEVAIRGIKPSGCRRICVIGSGAYSQTVLYALETQLGREIVAIDRSVRATTLALSVQEYHRLPDWVSYRCQDGGDVDYGGYDLVVIASLVLEKQEVLRRIVQTCAPNTIVLCRCPVGLGQLFYEQVPLEQMSSMEQLGAIRGSPRSFFKTMLMRRVSV
jgi:hypothetical protein